ncbi:WhiB family transcriptional regulator [Streptomyces sp. NPDC056056]|uniref:WhiB family transcriptional regulator n=1 Tax=Streptomyces sp. NPDC056056 TaxID=3345698 RepID=UPI0035D7A0E6
MSALKTLADFDGRACRSGQADLFFPKQTNREAVRYAQRLCMGCPIWGQCALEAIPLVEGREMADCVIAAVHLPYEEDLRSE